MPCNIKNPANTDLGSLEPHINGMYDYFDQKLGFQKPPTIVFDSDPSNQPNVLGKTAYYDPESLEIHIYSDGRHPKDMLRSIAHELIHHQQNMEGRLDVGGYSGPGYYLENDKLRVVEHEAMLEGNKLMREYEDTIKKESKDMSLKEWKNNELNKLLMKKFGILNEEKDGNKKTSKYDDNPKLKGGQKNLPDALQQGIIGATKGDKEEPEKEKEELEELAGRAEQSSDRLQTGEENTREQGRLREEDELEERAKGRRRTAALDPARDDDRTRPMEEEIEEGVVPASQGEYDAYRKKHSDQAKKKPVAKAKDQEEKNEAHCGKRDDKATKLRPYKENKVNLKELIEKVLKNNERIMEKLKDK